MPFGGLFEGGKRFDQNQCKVQLKLAISRLKLQKNKKENNIKNQKREIADLLKAGKDESARIKVENVIREDYIIEAYEILELFCELTLARLGVIQISRECPPDIKEAVCTFIYSAPRADIKELAVIREQLIAKFGKELAMDAMHNKDGCVNARIVHKLSIQTPENYVVFQYLNEIAKSFNLEWKAEFLAEPLPLHVDTQCCTPNQNMGKNNGTYIEPYSQIPNFPDPPRTGSIGGSSSGSSGGNQFLNFPSVPSMNNGSLSSSSSSSSSYSNQHGSVPEPSFPEPPNMNMQNNNYNNNNNMSNNNNSNIPIPNFNFGSMPGVNSNIDTIPPPSFGNNNNMMNSNNNNNNIPNFPTPPTLSFPDVPTNTNPNNNNNNNGGMSSGSGNGRNTNSNSLNLGDINLNFPNTTHSNSSPSVFDFPSPPRGDDVVEDSNVPDFDELTARFEKLKKKDF